MRDGFLEKRCGEITRQRVLAAALARFAQASYEEVKLRDIAADVGIDVALVHRSFGSKDQLFAAAFRAAIQTDRLLASDKSELSAVFAKDVFERSSDPASKHADALQIFIRSLSSPQAREVLRVYAARDFVGPLAAKLDDPVRHQRAALFTACVIGICILRDILHIEPLLDGARQESQPLIEQILGACLNDIRDAGPSTAEAVSTESTTGQPPPRLP